MSRRLIAVFLAWSVLLIFSTQIVWADPTDSGTIQITGSVPPKGTSITTSIDASSPNTPSKQDEEITITISYTSSNVGIIPMTFQAQWDKGTVQGASEANVDVVTYVPGSATTGYDGAVPIVDTQNRTVTWDIAGLPPDQPTQYVTFKLKTTSSYTGSRKVVFPVKVVVLSPIGASDHDLNLEYLYVSATSGTTGTTSLVSPTPSPTSSATTTSPTSLITTTEPLFSAIRQSTIGAIGARIATQTYRASSLIVLYGTQYPNLSNSKTLPLVPGSLAQEAVLTELLPNTRYYYQIKSLTYPDQISDVFTFVTASRIPDVGTVSPTFLTISHQRAVMFSGPVGELDFQQSYPLVLTSNSVLDLSVQLPEAKLISQVEAFVRSIGVLGMSSDSDVVDELQSQSTRMSKVGDNSYIGKVKVPNINDQYELIIRVEDIYGNIQEQSLNRFSVISPLTIYNAKTGTPLEHAEVEFFIFNEFTQLYEKVSNVSSAISNPAFSLATGEIKENFHPGKYKIKVTLAGFESQEVEFQIGDVFQDLPKVYLNPKGGIWNGYVLYFFGMLDHVLTNQFQLAQILIISEEVYKLFIILSVALTIGALILFYTVPKWPKFQASNWLFVPDQKGQSKYFRWVVFALLQFFRFCAEAILFTFLLMGIAFCWQRGILNGGAVLAGSIISICFWILFQYRIMKADQKSYQLKK